MDEQRLQFRVGLFVLLSIAIAGVMIVRFGDVQQYWQETYALAIQFPDAPGVHAGTPVRLNGIRIGRVREVILDDTEEGVLVVVDLYAHRKIRSDSQPSLIRTLLGDTTIDFSPGASPDTIPPNKRLRGKVPTDPMQIVQKMEQQVSETLVAFRSTSAEWQAVGENLNALMETERGKLDDVIARAAVALDEFTSAMKKASVTLESTNQLVSDPEVQAHLKQTIAALPEMVQETRDAIAAARLSTQKISQNLDKLNANLDNVHRATSPLAERSTVMVARLEKGLTEMESLLTELNTFAQMVNRNEGTLQKFVSDPELYKNLNRSAGSLSVLLQNLEPTLRDLRIFSDKVARHPELLGIRGAISGSTGIKEVQPQQEANQTGRFRR